MVFTIVGFLTKYLVIVALNFKHGAASRAALSIDAVVVVRDVSRVSNQMNCSSIIDAKARRTVAFGYDVNWATVRARSLFQYTIGFREFGNACQ